MSDYKEILGDGYLVSIKRKRRIVEVDVIQDDGSFELIEFEYEPSEYLFNALYDDTVGTKVYVEGTVWLSTTYQGTHYTLDLIHSVGYDYEPAHRRLHRLEHRVQELENELSRRS